MFIEPVFHPTLELQRSEMFGLVEITSRSYGAEEFCPAT
jgi:hypothetical protein